MLDRILLTNVVVEALVGVHEHERQAKRPLVVDLELACDLDPAATNDDLTLTVDYSALTTRVRERCAVSSYRLIEALAADIVRACFEDARVEGVKVTLRKPGAVPGADVAISLERRR
jgi:dihydroneopterin aldolase